MRKKENILAGRNLVLNLYVNMISIYIHSNAVTIHEHIIRNCIHSNKLTLYYFKES